MSRMGARAPAHFDDVPQTLVQPAWQQLSVELARQQRRRTDSYRRARATLMSLVSAHFARTTGGASGEGPCSQLLTWSTEHHHMLTTRSQYPAAGPETVCMLASAQQYQRFLLISCSCLLPLSADATLIDWTIDWGPQLQMPPVACQQPIRFGETAATSTATVPVLLRPQL